MYDRLQIALSCHSIVKHDQGSVVSGKAQGNMYNIFAIFIHVSEPGLVECLFL